LVQHERFPQVDKVIFIVGNLIRDRQDGLSVLILLNCEVGSIVDGLVTCVLIGVEKFFIFEYINELVCGGTGGPEMVTSI
jgi:hypothetical protein